MRNDGSSKERLSFRVSPTLNHGETACKTHFPRLEKKKKNLLNSEAGWVVTVRSGKRPLYVCDRVRNASPKGRSALLPRLQSPVLSHGETGVKVPPTSRKKKNPDLRGCAVEAAACMFFVGFFQNFVKDRARVPATVCSNNIINT